MRAHTHDARHVATPGSSLYAGDGHQKPISKNESLMLLQICFHLLLPFVVVLMRGAAANFSCQIEKILVLFVPFK